MSDLKYQLRKLLPSLSVQSRHNSNQEIKVRWKPIKRIVESSRSIAGCCSREGVSESWFNKWAKRLLSKKCLSALLSHSRKPKYSPKKTGKRTTKKIKKLRELFPYAGKETISQDLKDHFNINCPPSTVANVMRREGIIVPKKAKKTKPHNKRYRREVPGYLQMDFKYVPYEILGIQYYQLSAVDHHSSWRLIRMYPNKNQLAVMDFLEELKRRFPFPIIEIQTDNDAAFTDKFNSGEGVTGNHVMDQWCAKNEICHRLIPTSVKELNGKVENTHRQDEREFYKQFKAVNYDHLKAMAQWYNENWNKRRKTKTLGWMTPEQVLEEACIRQLAWLQLIAELYPSTNQLPLKIDDQGVLSLAVPATPLFRAKKGKFKNRTTRRNRVSRYLQYLDWDNRSRKKS